MGAMHGPALMSADVNFRALMGGCGGRSEINESHRMGGPRSDGRRAGKVWGGYGGVPAAYFNDFLFLLFKCAQ